MNLEKQVCSLPLAQRLKELGVKQESLFMWQVQSDGTAHVHLGMLEGFDVEYVSAFTVAELGEMLPTFIEGYKLECEKHSTGAWIISYYDHSKRKEFKSVLMATDDTNEADARAKMLVYLLEHNLVTL